MAPRRRLRCICVTEVTKTSAIGTTRPHSQALPRLGSGRQAMESSKAAPEASRATLGSCTMAASSVRSVSSLVKGFA